MGIRLNIYEKSPYEGLGTELLNGGSFGWGITSELNDCEIVNKYKDDCKNRNSYSGCFMCECSDSDYTKVTYEKLLTINKEILYRNTNIINAFCLNRDNCILEKECGLDCISNNHRNCIWVNFS